MYRAYGALFDEVVPWTDKKAIAADLKAIYGADTLEIAEANLEHFDETWGTSTRMSSSLGVITGKA